MDSLLVVATKIGEYSPYTRHRLIHLPDSIRELEQLRSTVQEFKEKISDVDMVQIINAIEAKISSLHNSRIA